MNQTSTKTNPTSTSSSSPAYDDISNNQDEDITVIPPPKMKMQVATTITFRYCHTCGYQNLFKQFSELVRTHYPNMAVIGENYPPPSLRAFLARILSMLKMGLLVCLLFGQNPFSLLSIPTPRIFHWALNNKMYACLMIFFLSNSLESYLVSTGAFEIIVDDVPLWSKLETGRLPSSNEFIQMLQPFNPNRDGSDQIRFNS
ncbi:unnamed protein product [Adineta steineri]|uniref:SelT-like protein n=1 Tax=Adineta steineri TaxID=433720 RepID=A0A818JEU6_9BILA|nr:unnamed protein product [Adineta steineri]CAF3538271.1 unnamed protein product [Adineta steineri]